MDQLQWCVFEEAVNKEAYMEFAHTSASKAIGFRAWVAYKYPCKTLLHCPGSTSGATKLQIGGTVIIADWGH